MRELIEGYGDAAVTSVGFFWKAGWAFVLGYPVNFSLAEHRGGLLALHQVGGLVDEVRGGIAN
jgi:hypothetical protein